MRQRPLYNQKQIFALEGLLEEVECAVAHGKHSALDGPKRRQEDDGECGISFVKASKDLFSRHSRHPHIQQDKVRRVRQALGESLFRVREDSNQRSGLPQHALNVLAQRGFVVDD